MAFHIRSTTLEQLRAEVGQLRTVISAPISTNDIRKFSIGIYWPETPPRLFWDEVFARETRFGGIVAPHEFNPFAWAIEGPGLLPTHPGRIGQRTYVAGSEAEYHTRMRPGDVITATDGCMDINERLGRSGRLAFITMETRWENQRRELVKVLRTRYVQLWPVSPGQPEPGGQRSTPSPGPEEGAGGEEIPPFIRRTDLMNWNMFAAVHDEFVDVHMDDEFARQRGDKGAIGMGNLRFSYLHSMLRHWLGDDGEIRSVGCQHRGLNYKNDTLTCRGRLTGGRADASTTLADLELWVENQNGEKTDLAQATVVLPSSTGRA